MIEDYFGNGKKFGVNIEYLREDAPLGTAGAISLLENRPKECFVVINGDVITEIKYDQLIDFHQENKAAATMAVFKYSWQNPFGVVRTEGVEIIDMEEKPVIQSYINAGVYVFESSILNLLRKSEFCDMPELFRRIKLAPQKVVAYPCHESWIDLGTSKDFTNLEKT
jgi:NDP-sugar pyrophosphorylase family protein